MSNQPHARRIRENYKMLGNAVLDLRECYSPPKGILNKKLKLGADVIEFLLAKYPEEGPGSLSNMKVCPSIESFVMGRSLLLMHNNHADVSYHRGIFIYIYSNQIADEHEIGTSMRASD